MIDYYSFWDIKEPPFEDNNNPKFFYRSTDHFEDLERLKYVIDSISMNLGLLSGEIGTGKTITKRVLIEELSKSSQNNIVVNIDSTSFSFNEILTEIVSRLLSVDPEVLPKKRYYLYKKLERFLEEDIICNNGMVYVFLDEAQKIASKDLDLLKDLTNINFDYTCPLKIILIGQPSILKNIKKLPQVDQRIGMRFHLNHMNSEDTAKYIETRLKVSGANQRIFSDEAVRLIYKKTIGTPREINRACKIAMDIASSKEEMLISGEIMEIVFQDLEYNGRDTKIMSYEKLSISELRRKRNEESLDSTEEQESKEKIESVDQEKKQRVVENTKNTPLQKEDLTPEKDDYLVKAEEVDFEKKKSAFISNPNETNEPSLVEYLEVAYRHKILILILLVVSMLGAYIVFLKQVPVYKTSAKIFIQEESMELQVVSNKPVLKKGLDLSTWVEILKSTDVCSRVSEYMSGRITPARAKGMIQCGISKGEDHIITIISTSTDPVLATDVANNFYFALRDYDTDVRRKNYLKTLSYLENELIKKNNDLDSLNSVVKELYAQKEFKNFGENLYDNIRRLNNFKDMLTTTEVELEAEEANIKALASKLEEEDSTYITETTYSEPLKIKLMNLEVDLARTLTTYGEDHPKVIGIKSNIENVKKLISNGVEESIQMRSIGHNPLKQQILKDLVESQTKSISLHQKRNALRKIIKEMELSPKDSSTLINKQREKDALIITITNLQQQINDVRLNSNIEFNRIIQLEEASVPGSPIGSKLYMLLLNGAMLGIALGAIIVFLFTRLDNKISSIKKLLSVYPNIPIIGTIPQFKFNPLKLNFLSFKDIEEENQHKEIIQNIFNEIALNFRYLILNKRNNALAVVSSLKGEGKSTITNHLAIALAKNNSKVLLVDADFYNPQSSRFYELSKAFGFSEVLSEQVALHEVVVKTRIDNLMVLPTGKRPPSVAHLYHSDRFPAILAEIKTICDIIIIDTPAIMYFPETSVLINQMDTVILTAKMDYTTLVSCRKLLKKLLIMDTNIGGIIANSIKKEVFNRSYNDYYQYGYEYYYRYNHYQEKINSPVKKGFNLFNWFTEIKFKNKLDRTFILEDEEPDFELNRDTNFGKISKPKGFGLLIYKLKSFLGLVDDIDWDE